MPASVSANLAVLSGLQEGVSVDVKTLCCHEEHTLTLTEAVPAEEYADDVKWAGWFESSDPSVEQSLLSVAPDRYDEFDIWLLDYLRDGTQSLSPISITTDPAQGRGAY